MPQPREWVFLLPSGSPEVREADSARHAACIARELMASSHMLATDWDRMKTQNHTAYCLMQEAYGVIPGYLLVGA